MKLQINGMTSGLFTNEVTYKTANYFIDSRFTTPNDSAVSFLNGLEYKKDFKDMFIEGDGNHLNSYGYSKWSVLFKHIFK